MGIRWKPNPKVMFFPVRQGGPGCAEKRGAGSSAVLLPALLGMGVWQPSAIPAGPCAAPFPPLLPVEGYPDREGRHPSLPPLPTL